jgi:hypothetical protein
VKRTGILGWFKNEFFGMNLDRSPGFPELRLYLSLNAWTSRVAAVGAYLLLIAIATLFLAGVFQTPPATWPIAIWGWAWVLGWVLVIFACVFLGLPKYARGFSRRDNYIHLNPDGLKVVWFGKITFWAWSEINGFITLTGRSVRRYVYLKGEKPGQGVYIPTPPQILETYAVGAHGYSDQSDLLNDWLERYGSPEPGFSFLASENAMWVRFGKRINTFFGVPDRDETNR